MYKVLFAGMALLISSLTQAAVYHIEVRDLDAGQPLTPPVAAVHSSNVSLLEVGGTATPGLEALAEDGLTDLLVGELSNSGDVFSVVVGGSAPTFGSYKFLVEGNPGDLFSVVSMFAKTNDNFIGAADVVLPSGNSPVVIDAVVYDSGTEVNTGLAAHIPAFGNVGVGETENGVISTINQFTLVDDPALGTVEFTWPPAAQVIITPLTEAVDYNITITGLSEGQPLTPPVVVVHDQRAQLFELGGTASPGLEEIAEEGSTGTLVGETTPVEGVWTVSVAGDGPGFEHQTTITAEPGLLLSIVTMFARTNDNITGVLNLELPPRGFNETVDTVVWDSGTEVNTGLVEHIPFYGSAGGPDENGVITNSNSFSVLDDPSGQLDFNWPPAASIEVQAVGIQSSVENFELYQ